MAEGMAALENSMAKELAELFGKGEYDTLQAVMGYVTSANPLMVQLDSSEEIPIGPLQYIRSRPKAGEHVLVLKDHDLLIVVGKGQGFLGDMVIMWQTSYTIDTFNGQSAQGVRYKVRRDSVWGSTLQIGIDSFQPLPFPPDTNLNLPRPEQISGAGGFVPGTVIANKNPNDQSFPNLSLSNPTRMLNGAYVTIGSYSFGETTGELRIYVRASGGGWSYAIPSGEIGTMSGSTNIPWSYGNILWHVLSRRTSPFDRVNARTEYNAGITTTTIDPVSINSSTHPRMRYHDSDNNLIHGATDPSGGFFTLYAYDDVTFAVKYISPPIPCSLQIDLIEFAGEGGSFFNLFHTPPAGIGLEVWGVTASPTGYTVEVEAVPPELSEWDLQQVFWNGGSISLISNFFTSAHNKEITERLNPGEYSPIVVVQLSDTINPLGLMSSVTAEELARVAGPYLNVQVFQDIAQVPFQNLYDYVEWVAPV